MGKLNAGQLTERITLLTSAAPVSDGRGGFVAGGPETEKAYWARVEPLSGQEVLALGQVLNSSAYRITLRNQPAIDRRAKQRVRWQGEMLNVQHVEPDVAGREYVILTCFDSGK